MAGRKGTRKPICDARVQFLGVIKLLCPFCGNVGQYRISLGQWKIICGNNDCHRHLGIGFRILIPDRSRSADSARIPPDYLFPVAPVVPEPIRVGSAAHELVLADDE